MTENAPTGPGRWIELVPVEVFGMACDDHPQPKPAAWGLMDAVEPWSDCNRADGQIYRVEDIPNAHRDPGETVRVWVPDAAWPFFDRHWGEGYELDGYDGIDMVAPAEVKDRP